MATNEPNKPDDVAVMPENEQTAPVMEAPVPEMIAEEAAREAEQSDPPEKQETEKPDKAPKKQAMRGKVATQEAQEAEVEDIRQEWEKPLSKVEPQKERIPRTEKQKPAMEKKALEKEETPAPEPEHSPEPKEAPRKGEAEQIVFLNLSELHAFNNHPFRVRDDEEMRAMVESVKDKGVTQPAIVRPREDGGYEIFSLLLRLLLNEMLL